MYGMIQNMASQLAGYQRAYLKRRAHALEPVVTVGKLANSAALQEHLDRELNNHELIKIRFVDHKEERHQLARELCSVSGAELVTIIGHVAILYRAHAEPEQRRISIPQRGVQ
jgi:RNA-binding protein